MGYSKRKSVIALVLVILITAGLACAAIFGITIGDTTIVASVTDEKNGIKRGLDLAGGSSILYEAQIEGELSAEEIDSGLNSCVAMIQQRLTNLGYTEATVARAGDNRISVEIPAVTNPEEAVQKLGSTAKLEFVDSDGNVVLSGSDIKNATSQYGRLTEAGAMQHFVELELTDEAVSKFAEATKNMAQKTDGKNYIAITLDGEVVSQPSVTEEINSSTCVISGNYSQEDAEWMANLIKSGQMPFALKEVQLSSVGPTLGEKALEQSLFAGAIGIVLVMVFLIVIYKMSGVVASLALMTYTTLVVLFCSLFQINLSLPGIAGIILGIGMAVDANVIIFERIKEELRAEKTVRSSVDAGFKRALAAIIDSNITTIIAAIVLKFLGTGPIVGFADTLLIGVITSMFTAVIVSRLLLKSLVGLGLKSIKAYGA